LQDIDHQARVKELKREIEKKELEWKNYLEVKKKSKDMIELAHRESTSLATRHDDYTSAVKEANRVKRDLAEIKRLLKQFTTPVLGEREIFDEFVHKSGRSSDISSWEILAEMRHHGVPTRLLDWTDQFEIALFFALEKYRYELTTLDWPDEPNDDALETLAKLPSPSIWILNPYKLCQKSTGRYSIWDITRELQYDYYRVLLSEKTWPFDMPIPIYAPSQLERIKSQSGYFTTFGNDKEPLEKQVGKNCLIKIEIEPQAAIFGLKYLLFFRGVSDFSVFRDLDTLGRELDRKFVRMQTNSV
jgi:hypothetical protein